jgi:hypothetical protein
VDPPLPPPPTVAIKRRHQRMEQPEEVWSFRVKRTFLFISVAHPGCLSRILIGIFSIPDPGSASKNLSILTQKIVSELSEI